MSDTPGLEDLVRAELTDYFNHLRTERDKGGDSKEFASAAHLSAAMKLLFRKAGDEDGDNPVQQVANRARDLARTSATPPPDGLKAPEESEDE